MKTTLLVLITSLGVIAPSYAQTIILQPNGDFGKDALISSLQPSTPGATYEDLLGASWTVSGAPVTLRGLIEFDLSQIPAGATISSATLTLYHNPLSVNAGAEHQSLSGSNAGIIQRVTTYWNEYLVTWDTQPQTTAQNGVIIPQSTSPDQDYSLDVTQLVQDMMDNPNTSFGFQIRLQTEEFYRSLVFASSDNVDPTNHPKLEITYVDVLGIAENGSSAISVSPNPASDFVMVSIPEKLVGRDYTIYDNSGRKMVEGTFTQHLQQVDLASLSNGMYFLKLNDETHQCVRILKN